MSGYLYILSHDHMPGLLKVGMTHRNPWTRAKELSGYTGVPGPYTVEYYSSVESPGLAERRAHSALKQFRTGKEFFRCDLTTAIAVIEQEISGLTRQFLRGELAEDVASKQVLRQEKKSLEAKLEKIERRINSRRSEIEDKVSVGWLVGIPIGLLTLVVLPRDISPVSAIIVAIVTGFFLSNLISPRINKLRFERHAANDSLLRDLTEQATECKDQFKSYAPIQSSVIPALTTATPETPASYSPPNPPNRADPPESGEATGNLAGKIGVILLVLALIAGVKLARINQMIPDDSNFSYQKPEPLNTLPHNEMPQNDVEGPTNFTQDLDSPLGSTGQSAFESRLMNHVKLNNGDLTLDELYAFAIAEGRNKHQVNLILHKNLTMNKISEYRTNKPISYFGD